MRRKFGVYYLRWYHPFNKVDDTKWRNPGVKRFNTYRTRCKLDILNVIQSVFTTSKYIFTLMCDNINDGLYVYINNLLIVS